jgi:hypothetical protein
VSLETLCAALSPTVLPAFGIPTAAFPDPFHHDTPDVCLDRMDAAVQGDGTFTFMPTGTRHRGLSVRVHGRRAVFTTTLSHRYSDEGVARRRQVRARGLLTKDGQGIWRLATLEPLLPLTLLDHPRPFSDTELAATYRKDRRRGAQAEARFEGEFGAIRSATAQAGTAAPCSVTMVDAEVGNQSFAGVQGFDEGRDPDSAPRHPEEHTDVDLIAAGSAKHCLALRTAAPLPERFDLNLNNKFEIDVADRKVVVYTDRAGKQVPLAGISASLNGNELVLHTPFSLAAVGGVELFANSFVDLAYGDFAFTLP